MRQDGVWGGQMEMNALAQRFEFNLIVHQVGNPSMVQCFHEPLGKFPTLHLSFHLDEHYNSVRRGDDPCMRGEPPITHYKIGHDLEKVKQQLQGVALDATNGYRPKNQKGKPVQVAKEQDEESKCDLITELAREALSKLGHEESKL